MKKIISSLVFEYMIIFVGVLLITNIVASTVVLMIFGFENLTILDTFNGIQKPTMIALRISLMSMVVGTFFIYIATKFVLKPINKLSEAAKKVTDGDFSVIIPSEGIIKNEITTLMDNFNLMVKELSKIEYLHKDFVSNVSHEFKTPITAILGYAELLASPTLKEDKRLEYAEIITRQSTRLSKLSTDLLRLSELESDQITIKSEIFRLDEQILDVILLLQSEWEQKNIDMDITLEKINFIGDKALIYQVWVNIIGNAIRYTNINGNIGVKLHHVDGRIIAVIKDNGIGMTVEQQNSIFERFYRVEESRTTEGTGLGLPIAKRIIVLHGGNIYAKSELNNGTEFVIEFEQKNDAF